MIMIHAVKKLQNTSRINAPLYVTEAPEGQWLYSWYASLVPTGRQGKQLVMYVHQPSRVTILCPGKTIQSSWPHFRLRLAELLRRWHFPKPFIEHELALADNYTVGKTDSRSMLGVINHYLEAIPDYLDRVTHLPYEKLPLAEWEDYFMTWVFYTDKSKTTLISPVNSLRAMVGLSESQEE